MNTLNYSKLSIYDLQAVIQLDAYKLNKQLNDFEDSEKTLKTACELLEEMKIYYEKLDELRDEIYIEIAKLNIKKERLLEFLPDQNTKYHILDNISDCIKDLKKDNEIESHNFT